MTLDGQGQRKGFLRKFLSSILVLPPCVGALSNLYSTKKAYRDDGHTHNILIIHDKLDIQYVKGKNKYSTSPPTVNNTVMIHNPLWDRVEFRR